MTNILFQPLDRFFTKWIGIKSNEVDVVEDASTVSLILLYM
ncbi:hypothetical protein [Gracilibacillus thailandensis]|nr:hypothetical protein [Gracilibacillus thailandensis]